MQPEPIRLVIWDLYETFWRGTLTEGGIKEFIDANSLAVIELSRRGIISSICSKNDFEAIKEILSVKVIWDYFVFPSIDWSPKGPRIRNLIEQFQLRPSTVIFIDDNPNNLGEAQSFVPDIQTASEAILSDILSDSRFSGKDDRNLTRLAQYKVLETKQREQSIAAASGSNLSFLRSCGVEVRIEPEVEPHIDRAIELINRTNQLNFTKIRLPENHDEAKQLLRAELKARWNWAGLVHVRDRFGDYGFVGFFLGSGEVKKQLHHFCFSCRTLGMEAERWVFEHLGKPELKVVGEVQSDLYAKEEIDWINSSDKKNISELESVVQEVRLRGGCDLDSMVHYFGPRVKKIVETNYIANYHFLRRDSSMNLVAALTGADTRLLNDDLASMGIDHDILRTELFAPCTHETLIVISLWGDAYIHHYKHKATGVCIGFTADVLDVHKLAITLDEPDADISSLLAHIEPGEIERRHALEAFVRGLRRDFKFDSVIDKPRLQKSLREILGSAPSNSRVVLILPPLRSLADGSRYPWGDLVVIREIEASISMEYEFARVVDVEECIESDSEVGTHWHFDRIVYYRVFKKITQLLSQTVDGNWPSRTSWK